MKSPKIALCERLRARVLSNSVIHATARGAMKVSVDAAMDRGARRKTMTRTSIDRAKAVIAKCLCDKKIANQNLLTTTKEQKIVSVCPVVTLPPSPNKKK